MATRVSSTAALAATLGTTITDLNDYRYQPSRISRAVYAIGNRYFCVGKKKPEIPELGGLEWREHPDKFWAERAGSVIWVAEV